MNIKKILFKTNSFDVEKSLPDATILIDNEGFILWVNDIAVQIFETSKMHMMTSNIADFVENAMEKIHNAVLLKSIIIIKYLNKEYYFDLSAKALESGYMLTIRPAGNYQINSDDNNKLISDELMNKISNEFKSPLQSIVGFSQAMFDGLGGELTEEQKKYIKIINKKSTDSLFFANKFFEYIFTNNNNDVINNSKFEIVNLINTLITLNKHLNKDKNVLFNLDINEITSVNIVSDQNLLKIAIQNIFDTILKNVEYGTFDIKIFNPSPEMITSNNLKPGKYVSLMFTSDSFLSEEKDLLYIFEPNKIINSSNKNKLLHSIMLSTAKNILQKLNGIIWIESKILKSTTINVILPLGE